MEHHLANLAPHKTVLDSQCKSDNVVQNTLVRAEYVAHHHNMQLISVDAINGARTGTDMCNLVSRALDQALVVDLALCSLVVLAGASGLSIEAIFSTPSHSGSRMEGADPLRPRGVHVNLAVQVAVVRNFQLRADFAYDPFALICLMLLGRSSPSRS